MSWNSNIATLLQTLPNYTPSSNDIIYSGMPCPRTTLEKAASSILKKEGIDPARLSILRVSTATLWPSGHRNPPLQFGHKIVFCAKGKQIQCLVEYAGQEIVEIMEKALHTNQSFCREQQNLRVFSQGFLRNGKTLKISY